MKNLFVVTTKYSFILLMAFFVFLSFVILDDRKGKSHKAAIRLQSAMMYTMHFMGFAIIYMNTNKDSVVVFYGAQVIYFVVFKGLMSVIYEEYYNKGLLNTMCMLLTIGFIMITRLNFDKAIRQFIIVVVASVAALILPDLICRLRALATITYVYCFAGLGFLATVLVIGQISNGAKLAIEIAGFSFQPSEFVKILYVFFLASLLGKSTRFKYIIISALFAGFHVIILVLSRDLGSALIFFVVYVIMIFVASCNVLYLLAGVGGGSLAAIIAYKLFAHVRVRVQAYLDPWSVIDNEGYQVTQSLFAIGTGGLFGLGLYKGAPKNIPIVDQDFIFSAIAEEMGQFFALLLIVLYISCFIAFMKIAMEQEEMFYKLVSLGIGVSVMIQTLLTIGGAIKFIPSTGVTLPLVSYGGSSILCTVLMFAVMQGIEVRTREIMEDKESE